MSARRAFVLGAIVGVGVLAAALAGVSLAARQDDGGSGTYDGKGTTLELAVTNTGTTGWKYIVFVPPAGSAFVSGHIRGGADAPCSAGRFVSGRGEVECGEFSPPVAPGEQVLITLSSDSALKPCGVPIEFYVSSTGVPPYTKVMSLTFSGSCEPPNCDAEMEAVSLANAELNRLSALRAKLVAELEQVQIRLDAFDYAYTEFLKTDALGHAFVQTVTLGFVDIQGDLIQEKHELLSLGFRLLRRIEALSQEIDRAAADVKKALAARDKCLAGGGSGGGLKSMSLVGTATAWATASCVNEAAALGKALGQAKAYGQLRALFAPLRLYKIATHARSTATRLHRAATAVARLRDGAKAAAALTKLATSLDRAASALARLASTTRGFAARAAVAHRQAVKAKAAYAKCAAPPHPSVSISEAGTWTYNTAIGKANICINVKTTPPQASISASVTGPNNYKANLPVTPLHPDGTRQIGAPITQPGAYTDTLTVYDTTGKQTATTTNTFTVAPSPQDGPTPKFGPPCPKPTQ
jgi:hypothetical protein